MCYDGITFRRSLERNLAFKAQEVKIFLAPIMTASLARQVEIRSGQERTQRLKENLRKALTDSTARDFSSLIY